MSSRTKQKPAVTVPIEIAFWAVVDQLELDVVDPVAAPPIKASARALHAQMIDYVHTIREVEG
jgi:hypothetical protein